MATATGKGSQKMLKFINYRMRVIMSDSRILIGQFLAFDRHMNLILSGTEEYRKITPKGKTKAEEREEKRVLGLILLRGESVISISVEGPPPSDDNRLKPKVSAQATGRALPQSRAIPLAQTTQVAPALVAPVRGIGGAGPMVMGRAMPMPVARGGMMPTPMAPPMSVPMGSMATPAPPMGRMMAPPTNMPPPPMGRMMAPPPMAPQGLMGRGPPPTR